MPIHHSDICFAFIFVFLLIAGFIRRYFRLKHHQLWTETARLALEKGQPLPKFGFNGRRWGAWWDFRRGLVLIAIGAALYYILPSQSQAWAALPGFIGIACLILSLCSLLRSDKPCNESNRDLPGQK